MVNTELDGSDLGPLAWVADELRKSLDSATKALKRFSQEAEALRGSDLAAVDTSQLRIARTQIHQALGAVEMVGLDSPAVMLRAMEAAVQSFVSKPQTCSVQKSAVVEAASFAVMEYLDASIAGRALSSISLFPQYRDVQAIVATVNVHPADLWTHAFVWVSPVRCEDLAQAAPLPYDQACRGRLDQALLGLMRGNVTESGSTLSQVSMGLAAGEARPRAKVFWQIAAAFGQAIAQGLVDVDVYVKRGLSGIVTQYVSLSKPDSVAQEKIARELLFFCANARPASDPKAVQVLTAVLAAYRLSGQIAVSYEKFVYGSFDPAVLSQARKRLGSAKEAWNAFSGGEKTKAKSSSDQIGLVCDSLAKLHAPSAQLAHVLRNLAKAVMESGRVPVPEVAMEVATTILFLEAMFEEFDPADPNLQERTNELASRLEIVQAGASSPPLTRWMEELYHRFSERSTLGSVVGELRTHLSELEKTLDHFFRDTAQVSILQDVPNRLTQMRGVLTVLGVDHAAQAVVRMREWVEQILSGQIDVQEGLLKGGIFEKIGNSLGALGFLIDMLGYQPNLAKNLFAYDAQSGELSPIMGRLTAPEQVIESVDVDFGTNTETASSAIVGFEATAVFSATDFDQAAQATQIMAAPQALAPVAAPAPVPEKPRLELPKDDSPDWEEDDLLGIFLEEAKEVFGNAQEALKALRVQPSDMEVRTTLRRAFHTLKGSSRMVGLTQFGEAAWAMEQAHNASLSEPGPCSSMLIDLSEQSIQAFEAWVGAIEASPSQGAAFSPQPFVTSAEALRLHGQYVPLQVQGAGAQSAPEPMPESAAEPAAPAAVVPAPEASDVVDFSFADIVEVAPEPEPIPVEAAPPAHTEWVSPLSEMQPSTDPEPAAPAVPDAATAPVEMAKLFDLTDAELEVIDFENDERFSLHELPPEPVVSAPAPTQTAESLPVVEFALEPEAQAAPEPVLQAAQEPSPELIDLSEVPESRASVAESVVEPDAPASVDENVKVIGDLRINLALYNVYLSEADEWSRRLQAEISELQLQPTAEPTDACVSWAHSLAGSSATVGLEELSQLAREFEAALMHAQKNSPQPAHARQLYMEAADEIRRVLHQFAAGFLSPVQADLPQRLHDCREAREIFEPKLVSPAALAQPMPTASEFAPAPVSEPAVSSEPQFRAGLFAAQEQPTAAAVPVFTPQDDDELDVVDAIDPDLFPIFEEEALELMPNLGAALRQWSSRADNHGAKNEALRLMHTLKGSARLAGALRLGELIHRMESEVEHLGSDVRSGDIEPLVGEFDRVSGVFEALRVSDVQAYQAALDEVAIEAQHAHEAHASQAPVSTAEPSVPVVVSPSVDAAPIGAGRAISVAAPLNLVVKQNNQTVRVKANLIDRMVNQAGEVMMTRSRLESEINNMRSSLSDLTGNLDKLRLQLRDIELQAESQMQSRMALAKEAQANFDPLEFDRFTRVQELTRMMAESVNDVATVQRNLQRTLQATEDDLIDQARQTRELQRDLLRTRMVEFEGISERLYRVVRLASKETGKPVRLDITGGNIEMDRGMLDRMTPAFEHMLRNCVAHGIEDTQVRSAAGKDPAGLITIALGQEGNDITVQFSDDGAGLNVTRIREKAVKLGLIAADAALSDAQAGEMIFMPGFSTADQVTELAGRGIGMDVVRAEVYALGGRIETSTQAGKGTQFKLVLPLTTAVTQVVMIRAAQLSVGVPSTMVEIVRRASGKELEMAYNSGVFDVGGGQTVPFFWSGALLQSSQRSTEPVGRTTPVVIFRSAAQRVAMHVDEVLGNQEVVVKNLGPQLSRLPGLAGMTLLPSGAAVLIYNPVALATIYGEQARSWSTDHAQPHVLGENAVSQPGSSPIVQIKSMVAPLVLVVDDSITVRKVTQRLLQREGYRVSLAADGLQALERLQEELPAIVLSDIEMPRMDGFDLARNIRGDAKMKHLPIVMITSRIAEKHREHAVSLGVNHYLGKPYSEEELLSLVKRYCTEEPALA